MAAFRDFVDDLKKYDEVKTVKEEVDWDLQASAMCAMSQKVGGPALEFTNVRGYPGATLLGGALAGPGFTVPSKRNMHGRIAIALGFEPDIGYEELQQSILARLMAPIGAIEVESGPSQEIVKEGKDIDLLQYPIPLLHDKDGGRYLTNQVVVTINPDNEVPNFGVYRLMLAGRDKLVHGGIYRPGVRRDIEAIVEKYHAKGEPMPFAIVIGAPPPMTMVACMHLPSGYPEYAFAGGLGAKPLVLVESKLSDILVPADAEIILEGHVYPNDTAEEGPFASISRYSDRREGFVYRIETITQRNDPVLPFVAEGVKGSDSMCLLSVLHSVEMLQVLPMATFGILPKWLTLPLETKLVLAVVSLRRPQPFPGLAARIANAMFGHSPFIRQAIFVDDDVEPYDLFTVMTDKIYKTRPENIIVDPMPKKLGLTENHNFKSGLTTCAYFDATWRLDRPEETIPRRVLFEVMYPDEMKEKVKKAWNEELKLSPKA